MSYKDLLTLKDLSKNEILDLINLAGKVKKNREKYSQKLKGKTLLMLFAKPSLRTHLSFDIAMHQLGGHAIFYSMQDSTLGKKESIQDFSKVISRYVDITMARLYKHAGIQELAAHSNKPVINGLTDAYHPCQVLGDLLTIKETFGSLKGKKIAYVGDANNNVTHSLILASSKLGLKISVSAPKKVEFMPNKKFIGSSKYEFHENPKKAVVNADVIYTDTWMSYQIPEKKQKSRMRNLKKYQVNKSLMNHANRAKFMHCLPAHRGHEVTNDVMDSDRSIVFDQAENRTYAEKAILLKLLRKG